MILILFISKITVFESFCLIIFVFTQTLKIHKREIENKIKEGVLIHEINDFNLIFFIL